MKNYSDRQIVISARRQIAAEEWRLILFFWISLTLFYVAFSPSTSSFMGYAEENLTAAEQVAGNFLNLARGEALARLSAVSWTRHGCTEVMLEAPLIVLSRIFFGESRIWSGRVNVLQTILATSLLCALLLIWTRRLTGGWVWAYWVALSAGVATMLWPYAYMGMETTQSLFLALAGYLSLERKRRRTRLELLQFTLACVIAVSAKQNGAFLLPAVGFLVWNYCRDEQGERWTAFAKYWKDAAIVVTAILAAMAINRYARGANWSNRGGEENYIATHFVGSPLGYLFNLIGYFGSPNKSLFVYAPLSLLCVLSLRRAFELRPEVVIWALLTLGGLAGGFAIVDVWTEETWGPRYLHTAIAPLVVCLAVSLQGRQFHWRRQKLLLASIFLGTAFSFLGVCFHYGVLYLSASRSSQSTLEALQGDSRFNHVRFNWRLLQVWGRGRLGMPSKPELWPPEPLWFYERPDDAPKLKQVDLREVAIPIPVLFRGWNEGSSASPNTYRLLRTLCVVSLLMSLSGLGWVCRKARKLDDTC